MSRKPYRTDDSDEEGSFAAPYLRLMDQREHDLREVFNALRWLVRAGAPWRMLPNDLPRWEVVHQQTRRWLDAGCFEAMVSDLRSIIRVAHGREGPITPAPMTQTFTTTHLLRQSRSARCATSPTAPPPHRRGRCPRS